ncbi:MAG: Tetratricopeptide 2 repeat protein [Chthoniobacteraceae bacterium]|nr:Tetratricopeptide 2 repeat protein [Chthoniobacteraceae bacterium]
MPKSDVKNARRLSNAILIVLIALIVQGAVLVRFSHSDQFIPHGNDMQFYSDWALRIAKGQWTDGKAFYGLPGYAYLLAAFYKPLGFDPFTVGAVQAVLFALIAGLLYKLALAAFRSSPAGEESAPHFSGADPRLIGWLAALGWIFFLPAQTFSVILMPTVWVLLAYWGSVWWLLKTRESSMAHPWILMGLFMGIFSMMVATILMLAPLVLFAIARSVAAGLPLKRRLPRIAAAAALFTAAVFAGSSPASLHNHLVAHEPVMLSAHGGINFWIGNNPIANGYPRMPPGLRSSQEGLLKDSVSQAEAAAGHPLKRFEISRYWSEKAHAYIHENRADWLRLMGAKFLNFWNAFQYDDITSIQTMREQGITWPGLRFGFVAALGLAGMAFACWRAAPPRWIAAAVVLHMLALMPVFITERYRLAAVPGLLLFGAWWMATLWTRLARRQWTGAVAMALAAMAAAAFVSIQRADATLWALDYYTTGIRTTESGDLDRAERNLRIAQSYSPFNADIPFALGNVFLARQDRDTAKRFYRHALELSPNHERVLNNLGVLAFEEKRWELAERFFMAALQTEPDNAKIHFLVARSRLERGDKDGARKELTKALQLNPAQREFIELQSTLDAP